MNRTVLLMCILLCALSCSTFNVTREINNSDAVDSTKKTGLLIRIPHNLNINKGEYIKSITHWISGFRPQKNLLLIADASDKLSYCVSEDERFYQETEDGHYLKFKSIGVINRYLSDNRMELKKLIEDNSLDSILIYEIYGVLANELQFIHYDTMLVMTDKNLKIIYMDRQNLYDVTEEMDINRMKDKFLDSMSDRLTRTLIRMDYLERRVYLGGESAAGGK